MICSLVEISLPDFDRFSSNFGIYRLRIVCSDDFGRVRRCRIPGWNGPLVKDCYRRISISELFLKEHVLVFVICYQFESKRGSESSSTDDNDGLTMGRILLRTRWGQRQLFEVLTKAVCVRRSWWLNHGWMLSGCRSQKHKEFMIISADVRNISMAIFVSSDSNIWGPNLNFLIKITEKVHF